MHHGVLGVENEIGPRRVLFDLAGPVLIVPGMAVAPEIFSSIPTALHGNSRTRPVRTFRLSVAQVCFHSRLRGGAGEVV